MARGSAQFVLLGVLLVGCIGSIVFVKLSLDETGRDREEPREEWAEQASSRSPTRRDPDPLVEPEPDPPAEERVEEPEEEDSARNDEKPIDERPMAGEYAELTLELVRPKSADERLIVITVTDETIAPMEDVLIVFRANEQIIYRERTDIEGVVEFRPHDDEEGPFRIDAITPYYSPGTLTDVRPGAQRRIELEAQPWIEGRVRAPSKGYGLVTLWTPNGKQTTNVEADGTFAFFGLDPGWHTVRAEVEPYGSDEASFELASGTRQWVDLKVKLRDRVRIFGDITVWPRSGGKAWINGVEVPVTARGRYIFKKAVIGLNEIEVDAPERPLFKARFYVEGRKKSEYDFDFYPEGWITGLVSAEKNNTRLEGAEVRIGIDYLDPHNDDASQFPIERVPLVLTDKKGQFEIRRLELGTTYLISIVKHPHGQFLGRFTAKKLGVHRMKLPTGPFLYGRLRGLGGIPRGATVTARRLLETPQTSIFNVKEWDVTRSERDRKGYYALSGLLADVYLVRVEAPGFGATETVLDLRDGYEGRMDMRLRAGVADRVEDAELLKRLPPVVESGEEVAVERRGITTVLTIDAARMDNAVPFPGVFVRFFENDMEYSAPMSFQESTFDLVGLEEATYRAVLTHPLLKKPIIVDDIKLIRGEPRQVKLRERSD